MNCSAIDRMKPREGAQHRGLAAAVRTDEGGDGAGPQLQRDVVHDAIPAIPQRKVLATEGAFGRGKKV